MNEIALTDNNNLSLHRETYHDLVNRYLALSDISQKSKKFYKKVLSYWKQWCDTNNVTSPTRENFLVYKTRLNDKSKYTQAVYLSIIGEFYKWLDNEGICKDITKGIKTKNRQADRHTRSQLTINEIHKLLQSINTQAIAGKRDYAIINLMIRTGLRMVEVHRANTADLAIINDRQVLYIQGKGRTHKDEFVILTNETFKPIQEYLLIRNCDTAIPLFTSHSQRAFSVNTDKEGRLAVDSIRRMVWSRLKQANIKRNDVVGHSLRHTTATIAIDSGATIEEVQSLMRHKDPRTTMIYIKNRDRFKNAAEDKIKF